jgi:hypothetical protein
MSPESMHLSAQGSMGPSTGRAVIALALGVLALVSFVLLALPTDLILIETPGVLGVIARALYPLALGPEILFSPIGLVIAIAAIVVGRGAVGVAPAGRIQDAWLARAGLILGWITVALYLVSLGLVILSFMGVAKPLI